MEHRIPFEQRKATLPISMANEDIELLRLQAERCHQNISEYVRSLIYIGLARVGAKRP